MKRKRTVEGRCGQDGLALVVALIVLIAMSLAGTAIMRSVDTSFLIAGNLAFRRGATTSGDAGVEAARTWLLANNNSSLYADQSGDGYYATSQDTLDLTGNATPGDTSDDVSWAGAAGISQPKCLSADAAGNAVCYIVHRLCSAAGALDAATCSTKQSVRGGSGLGGLSHQGDYQGSKSLTADMAYYRITVRTAGPRENVSFIQAFLLI